MSALFVVVDTGEREVYMIADDDLDATEKAVARFGSINYVEFYSDDPDDCPYPEDIKGEVWE